MEGAHVGDANEAGQQAKPEDPMPTEEKVTLVCCLPMSDSALAYRTFRRQFKYLVFVLIALFLPHWVARNVLSNVPRFVQFETFAGQYIEEPYSALIGVLGWVGSLVSSSQGAELASKQVPEGDSSFFAIAAIMSMGLGYAGINGHSILLGFSAIAINFLAGAMMTMNVSMSSKKKD